MTPTASWSPSASNLFHAFSFLNLDRSGLEDVLKTYGQDEYIGLNQDVLKASSRRLLKTKTKDVFIQTNVCPVSVLFLSTKWREDCPPLLVSRLAFMQFLMKFNFSAQMKMLRKIIDSTSLENSQENIIMEFDLVKL